MPKAEGAEKGKVGGRATLRADTSTELITYSGPKTEFNSYPKAENKGT